MLSVPHSANLPAVTSPPRCVQPAFFSSLSPCLSSLCSFFQQPDLTRTSVSTFVCVGRPARFSRRQRRRRRWSYGVCRMMSTFGQHKRLFRFFPEHPALVFFMRPTMGERGPSFHDSARSRSLFRLYTRTPTLTQFLFHGSDGRKKRAFRSRKSTFTLR